ncbi:ATPase [Actinoplanes cyaneus]|uniref:ATPase n=1 Tax=Actinoplanes cyaneus TaxID=52696 RepID=A0A919M7C6_9ACTN|nr:hypothetical protein [Actinoplanes cyaneus]MCW2142461.1 MinD-like ATPase involved in chromosome partitioning or flagellar assembly [Actinoplanes cyaneus]GID65269.1 ATPase [Actinoplanes cyaneus]
MDDIPELDDEPSPDHERRSAQAAAAELAGMGIDPAVLGLDPVAPPPVPFAGRTGARPPSADRLPAPPPQFTGAAPAQARIGSVLNRPLGGSQPAGVPGRPADFRPASAPPAVTPPVVLPPRLHRAVRAVTFGLVQPGAAAAMDQERDLVARVRTRRREGRTVAFIAGKGGVGATTTALGAALTLAALRTDLTAVVDARHGTPSIGQRLAGRAAPTVADCQPQPGHGGSPAGPLMLDGRLGVVDGLPWFGPAPGRQVVQLLDHLKERFSFTLADLGNDIDWAGQSVLARADQTVVVTTPYPDAAAALRTTLGRIHRLDPQRLDTIVVAVVCLTARQFRHTARRLYAGLGLGPARLIPVPFDPYLARGELLRADLLRPATREAYLRIAGAVADPGQATRAVPAPPAAVNARGVASVRRHDPLPPPPALPRPPGRGRPS